MKAILLSLSLTVFFTAGCSRSNNLLFGTVETTLGSHRVVVTDCYRLHVPLPHQMKERSGENSYRFMPCRDADVLIRQNLLEVNGEVYGRIGPNDSILVDHGSVSINGRAAALNAPNLPVTTHP